MGTIVGELIIAGLVNAGVGAYAGAEISASAIAIAGVNVSASTIGATVLIAASAGLNYALMSTPKQPRPGGGLLSIRQPNPVRQGVYGFAVRVAGSYMLYDIVPPAGVQSIDVLALVSGQICGFRQFYLNDDAVTLTGNTVNIQADGRYAFSSVGLDWRVGLPAETAYAAPVSLVPASWTVNHRGDAVASLEISCLQAANIDDQTNVFPNGLPNPTAVVDGFPLWDPRDAAQDPDDPATWIAYPVYNAAATYAAGDRVIVPATSKVAAAWSAATTYARNAMVTQAGVDYYSRVDGNIGITPGTDLAKWQAVGTPYYARVAGVLASPAQWCCVISNPVLQRIDYLTSRDHGMGLDRSKLIDPVLATLMAKANLCDELVLDRNGNSEPRYACCGKFNFDEDPADVLGAIDATCDLWETEDGEGHLAIEVGVYQAPTVSLRLDDGSLLMGPFSIDYDVADESTINELQITYTDPASKYQEVAGRPWRNEADISARGLVRSQSLALPFVRKHSQARRLAKRAMARLSMPHGTLTAPLAGLQALGQRWVKISYPIIPELADAVVELSKGSIDFMRGTVTFEWLLIDPTTIDAWDPATEEDGPISSGLDYSDGGNAIHWLFLGAI
jgi:hypothetical protein